MTDSEYFEMDYLSYSKLASFDEKGAKSINKSYSGDTEAFNLGALVEELLQGDKNSLKSNFIITDNIKPTASLGVLADAMIENNAEHKLETAVTLAKKLGLWSSIVKQEVYEAKIGTVQFWEYLKNKRSNKRIVSKEMHHKALEMKNGLLNGEFTKDIFKSSKNVMSLNQMVLVWNDKTLKSKLDLVKIDHKNETITPYDLKTIGSDKEGFIKSFYKWRYYIQASMYYDAVSESLTQEASSATYGYKMKPFQFIVVQSQDPANPMVYTVSDAKIREGRDGFYSEDGKLIRKGYKQLIEEYNWHINENKFDFSIETYNANGNILIE
jgi:hypothetical protein